MFTWNGIAPARILYIFKRQLKSEKANYIIHRQELEQILVESINEVKKDIAKRKAMMGLREFHKGPELPEEIDFSKFSVSDKK